MSWHEGLQVLQSLRNPAGLPLEKCSSWNQFDFLVPILLANACVSDPIRIVYLCLCPYLCIILCFVELRQLLLRAESENHVCVRACVRGWVGVCLCLCLCLSVCLSPYSPLISIHFLLIQRSKAETEGAAPLRRCFMLAECLCFDLPELIRIVVSRRTFLEKGTGTSHCTLECSACVGFRHCTALRTSRCQALYLPETQKLRRI